MKTTLRKALSLLLAVMMIFGTAAFDVADVGWAKFAVKANAEEVATSGEFSNTITWVFDVDTGELVISGTGDDWGTLGTGVGELYDDVLSIKVSDGITGIEEYGLSGYINVKTIEIAQSVTSIGECAFEGCSSIENIYIHSKIEHIDYRAFINCHSLKSISVEPSNAYYLSDENGVLFTKDKKVLISYPIGNKRTSYSVPNGVETIADYAFSNCRYLIDITLPNGLKTISAGAFFDNDKLKTIVIPSSVKEIKGSAFSGCRVLETVTLNEGLEVLGTDAFQLCKNLKSISIPSTVNTLGSAFAGCENLESAIVIPVGIEIIERDTFSGCKKISEVTLPDTVKSIGNYAFSDCENLKSIVFPVLLEELWPYAFANTGLQDVVIPANVSGLDSTVFEDCDEIKKFTVDSKNANYMSEDGVLYNKDKTKLISYPSASDKTSYVLPKEVSAISGNAFSGNCEKLESILVETGNTSFSNDSNGVLFNKDKTILKKYPSGNKTAKYSIPSSVLGWNSYAIRNCKNLEELVIPAGVKSCATEYIDVSFAFEGCDKLKRITVDPANTSLSNDENGVLFNKGKTIIIRYPAGKADENYSIPYGVVDISFNAFYDCDNLKKVNIPSTLNDGIFDIYRTGNIEEYEVDPENPNYSSDEFGVVYNKDKTFLLVYPGGKKSKSYSYPDTITSISGLNMINEYVEEIYVPKSVVFIHQFDIGVPSLTDIYYEGTEEDWDKISFNGDKCYDEFVNDVTIHYLGNSYIATWVVDGKQTAQEVKVGAKITPPANPTKSGYTFKGWSPAVPATMPEKDMTFTAVFEKNAYTVTWVVDGKKTSQNYEYGAKITPPANPTKSGYVFKGWDSAVPATMPAKNMTFTAVFEKAVYTATWVVDGTKTSHKYEYGAKITPLANPTKSGYIFKGWNPAVPATMPAKNMTFTAIFEKNPEKNIYNLGEETYSFSNPTEKNDYYKCKNGARGHCFAMSVTSSGYYIGELDISSAGAKKGQVLYDLTLTPEVQHPLCFYQARQGKYSRNSTVAGGSWYLTKKYNINSDWNEVVNYVKNHEYDGKGTLQIGFRGEQIRKGIISEGGHAINFLRYEEVNGQPRIYAYDSNFPNTETYFYKDSDGNIKQAPKETFNYSIKCIALRSIPKYFEIVDDYDSANYIYAEKDSLSVIGADAYIMEGTVDGTEFVMYEVPENAEEVIIVPLVDNAEFTYIEETYSMGNVDDDSIGIFTLASDDEYGMDNTGLEIVNIGFDIRTPSTTTISYGDSIVLHADVENLPEGAKIVWSADNSNFTYKASADGTTCTVSPSANGDTTFTATVVDANGNEIAKEEQTMTAKAGFFQKIIAFFKSLFGMTKVIPEVFKF